MKAEHYDLTGPENGAARTSDLSDETIYRAFEEMTDLTEQEQPKSHTKFYGDGSAWTTWPMGEPSKATADMEKTKFHLARDARKDPAPEMSDDEVYEAVRAMTNWERD
jgi:hypothetical protein